MVGQVQSSVKELKFRVEPVTDRVKVERAESRVVGDC